VPAAGRIGLFIALIAAAFVLLAVLTVPIGPAIPGPTTGAGTAPNPAPPTTTTVPSVSGTTPPSPIATPSPVIGLDEGDLAPDFTLPSLAGGPVSLSDYRGKVVWINFWAPWCPACITEMPRLEDFWVQWRAAGLVILGVGVKDTPERMREFVRIVGVDYPIVVDEDGSVAARYHAFALPVHYWIDREGIVGAWAFGELPPDALLDALRKVLPEAGN
jgi:peroxiredoxin